MKGEIRRQALNSFNREGSEDFIFLDPPYEMEEAYRQVLEALSKSGLLKHESIVIAEHHKKFDPGEAFGWLRRYRKLVQGDAALSFYRLASA